MSIPSPASLVSYAVREEEPLEAEFPNTPSSCMAKPTIEGGPGAVQSGLEDPLKHDVVSAYFFMITLHLANMVGKSAYHNMQFA